MELKTSDLAEFIDNDKEIYKEYSWTGSFNDYLAIVAKTPSVVRTAFARAYDMVLFYGVIKYTEYKSEIIHYKFFDDPFEDGKNAVFGLDTALMSFVNVLKAAASRYGPEKRILLFHGPVGSAKSTIVRLLKKGLEDYSKKLEGALYSFSWKEDKELVLCPMHEEPLRLLPLKPREKVTKKLNVYVEGDLCPSCRWYYNFHLKEYEGDWVKMVEEKILVRRLILSERDRIGIGTFQPKDEKNQDSTELTGDLNYRKIAEYGSDSDPRAFNFDGELNIGNRGLVEFVEVLKLDVAFLYDLLGASQEHKIKPKKFPQTDIDEVIIGHTNEPEYRKLQNNEFMEALRDRTIKIDIPYVVRLDEEISIYRRDFETERVKKLHHIAPHTVEMAALWAVLTRLEDPKKANLDLLQKAKLYNGRTLPGFTEDNIVELKKESAREGMDGVSPRYIQDKISNALVNEYDVKEYDSEKREGEKPKKCLNPFMVLNELEKGLAHHSLITSEDKRQKFKALLAIVKTEYEEIVKEEIQKAISADEESLKRLCGNYIDNVKAYTQKERVINKFTGQKEEPDEKLMRSVEEKIDIPEGRKDDFRREIMNYIGALAVDGKTFDYKSNERLLKALEAKLFEDQKDSIKLTSIVSSVVDKETQEKIDIVKSRMIKNYGYCEVCSTDALNYIASILARGDKK